MRIALLLMAAVAFAACTAKNSDVKNAAPSASGGPPAELARSPSSDRLPDDLRPPRE